MPKPTPDERATMRDGSTVSGRADLVAQAVSIDQDIRAQEAAWIDQLRADGVKAAHPDDGWVDREKNTVVLAYPQFGDELGGNLEIGDRLALGWPWDKTRIVRVTGFSTNRFVVPRTDRWYVHFEEL